MSDEGNLLRDLTRESWDSFVAMPRWAQATLVLGMAVHIAAVFAPPQLLPHALLATIRVAAFVAIIVGLIENAKHFDEFYVRVYLDACTVAFVLSSLVLYGAANYGYDLGIRAIGLLAGTFVIGFVAAFARLRRRA